MKRFIVFIIIIACALSIISCGTESSGEANVNGVEMTAKIISINDKIEVEVIENENGMTGIFWVNFSSDTIFLDENGSKISLLSLGVGDEIIITYSGQVMMSYPPQISAKKIQLK